MNNKTRIHSALTIVAVLLLAWPSMAVAQPTTSDFQQAVAAYQQSPSDAAAEKVIKLAVALDQPPPIPTEARKHFVRGATLAKDAKSPDDFSQVSEEFSQAVRIAPWWPEALYNLALAQGAAGDYAKGITSLQHYQMFKLSDAEAQAVQDKIWGFEAKQEKVVKDKELAAATRAEEERRKAYESSPEGIAAKQLEEERQWLKRLDGAIYSVRHGDMWQIRGNELWSGWQGTIDGRRRLTITHRQARFTCDAKDSQGYVMNVEIQTTWVLTIADDGSSITVSGLPGQPTPVYDGWVLPRTR